jgi:hypothetical protein
MVSFSDFKGPDGHIDWPAVRAAEVAAGERCYQCKRLSIPSRGYRALCASCGALADPYEVVHSNMIRCPDCGVARIVEDLYQEGTHSVTCYECDYEFTVECTVSYSFTSPARLPDEPEDDDSTTGPQAAQGVQK